MIHMPVPLFESPGRETLSRWYILPFDPGGHFKIPTSGRGKNPRVAPQRSSEREGQVLPRPMRQTEPTGLQAPGKCKRRIP